MSETFLMAVEVTFDVLYLAVIWGLVLAMLRRFPAVGPAEQRVARLTTIAFGLLALGDTGHVGFRVVAYALAGTTAQSTLVGAGALMTAITVTLFYVLMLAIWRSRFQKPYGAFGYVLLGAALIRLVLLAMPGNEWYSSVPPQPWSLIRNLPLIVQGLGVAYLVLRDARATQDRTFWWIGISILVSYACYIPVILFVQQVPLIGMLMMPKTLAYVAVCILAYRELFRAPARLPVAAG